MNDYGKTPEWCIEMAEAFREVERVASSGGAYQVAIRASKAADALEYAKNLDEGAKLSESCLKPITPA